MLIGIGTDLARVQRFADLLERRGDALARRLLTVSEREGLKQAAQPAAFFAKRFAAKEALLKALGTGLRDGLSWQHLEVYNNELGKPLLRLSGRAAELAEKLGVTRIHLSISDEVDMALAFVVLEAD